MKRKTNRGYAIKLLGIGFFAFLLLGSLGWVYRSSILTGSLDIELAKQGSIEHNQTVTAVFANEEVLIQAPAAGKPEYLGKEGQRFRRGDLLALMKPEGVTLSQSQDKAGVQVTAPDGGILFYGTDGLESILTPKNLLAMDLSKVLDQNATPKDSSSSVQTGETIGKMVNNLRPTVALIKITPSEETKLGKTLKFSINGQVYSAKVVRVQEDPPGIVVQFTQYVEGTANQRIQEISWNTQPSANGVIISKSTLWNNGEEQGVYVVLEGVLQFRKVKVLDENDQWVCVENLPYGIPVIINPRSGLDGLTMKVKIPS